MSKVCGVVNLKQNDQIIYDKLPIKGIKDCHKIIYKENNIHVTILCHDNKIEMRRKSLEYDIEMFFEQDKILKGNYHILEFGTNIALETKTNFLYYDDHKIEIHYNMNLDTEETGHFYFSLELEV